MNMLPLSKKKFLSFVVFSSLIVFFILELSSNLVLKIFYTPNILEDEHGEYDLGLDINPFVESDKDIKYHIRRDPFTKTTKAYPVTLEPGNKVPGIISYDLKEGIVRNSRGDTLINKWGFRGPYVEKEKPDFIQNSSTRGFHYCRKIRECANLSKIARAHVKWPRQWFDLSSLKFWGLGL